MPFIKPLENNGATQQVIGRERETATFLSRGLFTINLSVAVSRHVNAAVRPLRVKMEFCISHIFAYNFRMLLPRYELKSDESLIVFEFLSVGRKGEIPKIV